MASTELEQAKTNVPALMQTPALEITAEDVALPRLYIAQDTSKATKARLVDRGDLFTATGEDDPEPNVLWSPPKGNAKAKQGPLFHVIGLKKGKSLSVDGELQLFDYDDPDAPAEAWVTYNYFIAMPEVDTDVPFKLLLTRSNRPAALAINTVLKKTVAQGPAWINAFRITTAERHNTKGDWFVARVAQVEAKDTNIKAAETLAVMMSTQSVDAGSTGEEPAI